MTIAKKCIGCQSNKQQGTVLYSSCQLSLGIFRDYKLHAIFRNNYCPCVLCIVKPTCTDPKVSRFGYALSPSKVHHKCMLYKERIKEFRDYIYEKKGVTILS